MYESFAPLDDWSVRPRVISYVRKGSGLQADQIRPITSRDLTFLQVQTSHSLPLLIINTYNAPPGSKDAGQAIQLLFTLPSSSLRSAFLCGDFNTLHTRWDAFTDRTSPLAGPFIDWLDANHFTFLSESGVSTHKRGNVLDLAFLTGPLTASTIVASDFDTTADHTPLLSTINWSPRAIQPPKRLRIDTLDQELFTSILTTELAALPPYTTPPSDASLDTEASDLTQAISTALNGSTKRTLGLNTGYPWWNEACKQAVTIHKALATEDTARILRNTVRNAKRGY
jgi:hypothetical protein